LEEPLISTSTSIFLASATTWLLVMM